MAEKILIGVYACISALILALMIVQARSGEKKPDRTEESNRKAKKDRAEEKDRHNRN